MRYVPAWTGSNTIDAEFGKGGVGKCSHAQPEAAGDIPKRSRQPAHITTVRGKTDGLGHQSEHVLARGGGDKIGGLARKEIEGKAIACINESTFYNHRLV